MPDRVLSSVVWSGLTSNSLTEAIPGKVPLLTKYWLALVSMLPSVARHGMHACIAGYQEGNSPLEGNVVHHSDVHV